MKVNLMQYDDASDTFQQAGTVHLLNGKAVPDGGARDVLQGYKVMCEHHPGGCPTAPGEHYLGALAAGYQGTYYGAEVEQ